MSAIEKHLIFELPALKEALCEVRYSPLSPDDVKRIPGSLVALLSEQYPLFDVVDESPFKFSVGGNVVTENIRRFCFSSEEHSYFVTVKNDSFSFGLKPNESNKYTWIDYHKKLCEEWDRVSYTLELDEIHRIGMRFMNFLEVDDSNDEYLSSETKYIPKVGLESSQPFFNRNEFSIDDKNRFIVMAASQQGKKSGKKELVLDIDRIIEDQDMKADCLSNVAQKLHDDIEKVFFESITDTYKAIMKPIK